MLVQWCNVIDVLVPALANEIQFIHCGPSMGVARPPNFPARTRETGQTAQYEATSAHSRIPVRTKGIPPSARS